MQGQLAEMPDSCLHTTVELWSGLANDARFEHRVARRISRLVNHHLPEYSTEPVLAPRYDSTDNLETLLRVSRVGERLLGTE